MPPSTIATPPPLPSTLSSRLRSSLDPTTGCCRHHPAVQLCELVQGGARWVVRRKICYKCGARPKSGAGAKHRPGVSVANPHKTEDKREGREGRRSRSVSVDRLGRSARGAEVDGRERRRSASHDRHGSRSAARRASGNQVGTGGPLDLRNNPLVASSHRLEAAGRGRRSSRELTNEGGKPERNPGRSRSQSNDAPEAGLEGKEKPRRGKDRRESKTRGSGASLHSRALEYTAKALEETADCRDPRHHGIARQPRTEQANEGALVPARPRELVQAAEEEPGFDESDPVIAIPALTFGEDGAPNLPPPPPRTSEEMERHKERLEMRRAHIRREREVRRRRRASERANVAAIPEAIEKQGKRQSAPAANLMPSATALTTLGGDHKKERAAKRHSELPSAAAMALLEGRTPAQIQDNGEAAPSTAVAALDATLARKSERKLQASDRRKSRSRARTRNRARSHDADDGTETSELSFGTAKPWSPPTVGKGRGRGMGGEHVRRHPELEGVALPAAPLDEDAPLTPPVDITVDRSRSASRSRQSGSRVSGEDPPSGRTPNGRERTKQDPEQGRRASSRALVVQEPTKEPKKERPKRRESSLALVQKVNDAADRARPKAEARAPAKESKPTRRSAGRPAKDKTFHKSMPTLAASSARSSRRSSARGRVWDAHGNEVESKQVRTASQSVGNRSRARSEGAPAGGRAARSPTAPKAKKDRPLGRKFAGAPSPTHSKDGRSRGTRSTHPESSSSDEWRSSSPAPMVIRKARAAKKRPSLRMEELEVGTYVEKPFANISFHSGKESGDERSRTSSISAGSTVAGETTVEEYDDASDEVGRGRSRSRAMDALKGVQGGAKKLGTRSKSALGGWKGARRKWQSALFV